MEMPSMIDDPELDNWWSLADTIRDYPYNAYLVDLSMNGL